MIRGVLWATRDHFDGRHYHRGVIWPAHRSDRFGAIKPRRLIGREQGGWIIADVSDAKAEEATRSAHGAEIIEP